MKKRIIRCLFFIVSILYSSTLLADDVTLFWDPPTTNEDGTPLTDLSGYKIYYGTGSGNYSNVVNVGNVTSYTVLNLTGGVTYYFAATAYNIYGNESKYSNEVSKTARPTLYVSKSGTGSGTVTSSPAGINCGSDCTESYNQGTAVTLSSMPYGDSTFMGWTNGACSGTGLCILTINANTTITAIFNILPPIANFTAFPTSGALPLYVGFTDTSANSPSSWAWTFGNGGTSYLKSPGYTYKTAGSYTVSLTVSNASGTDSEVKNNYISVSTCPNQPIKIGGVYYPTLQVAYDAVVAGATIQVQALDFTENLNFDRNVVVTLKGGYDCWYANNPSGTGINGAIIISNGVVTLENVVLQ
ncbi:MAG: PKD domain-containing protein [Nitrospirota bacterium]